MGEIIEFRGAVRRGQLSWPAPERPCWAQPGGWRVEALRPARHLPAAWRVTPAGLEARFSLIECAGIVQQTKTWLEQWLTVQGWRSLDPDWAPYYDAGYHSKVRGWLIEERGYLRGLQARLRATSRAAARGGTALAAEFCGPGARSAGEFAQLFCDGLRAGLSPEMGARHA